MDPDIIEDKALHLMLERIKYNNPKQVIKELTEFIVGCLQYYLRNCGRDWKSWENCKAGNIIANVTNAIRHTFEEFALGLRGCSTIPYEVKVREAHFSQINSPTITIDLTIDSHLCVSFEEAIGRLIYPCQYK